MVIVYMPETDIDLYRKDTMKSKCICRWTLIIRK